MRKEVFYNLTILLYVNDQALPFFIFVGTKGKSRYICNGQPNCCSESNKCGQMEGDCNSDSECLDGLKCGNNNCNENSGNWVNADDCCYKPKSNFIVKILYVYYIRVLRKITKFTKKYFLFHESKFLL